MSYGIYKYTEDYPAYSYDSEANNSEIYKYKENIIINNHSFTYGLIRKVSIGLGFGYLFQKKLKNESKTVANIKASLHKTVENKGLTDFELFATYVAERTKSYQLSFDSSVTISPDDKKVSTSSSTKKSKDGNGFSGGHTFSLMANYVRALNPDLEIVPSLGFKYYFSTTEKYLGRPDATETEWIYDPYFEYTFKLAAQYNFGEKFKIGSKLGVTYANDIEYTRYTNKRVVTNLFIEEANFALLGNLNTKFLIVKNFLISLDFNYYHYIDDLKTKVLSPTNGFIYKYLTKDFSDFDFVLGLEANF